MVALVSNWDNPTIQADIRFADEKEGWPDGQICVHASNQQDTDGPEALGWPKGLLFGLTSAAKRKG